MELWNEFELKKPPLMTIPMKGLKFDPSELRKLVDNALTFYSSRNELEEAAALCSRLIARRRNSFRKMDGFKALCKVNTALCRLLRVDIKEVLSNFLGVLPEFSMGSTYETHIPSKASLDYVLLRFIGLHKIFLRITYYCEQVASYFSKLLNKNYFIEIITLILAVVANIWKQSHKLRSNTANFYSSLLKYRNLLPPPRRLWITEDFFFPEQLEGFVKEFATNESKSEEKQPENKNIILELRKVLDTGKKDYKNKLYQLQIAETQETESNSYIDIGTAICRETLSPKFDINEFSSVDRVRDFIQSEDKSRRKSMQNCLTKGIPGEEWTVIKKRIKNKINSNDTRAVIKTFKMLFKNKI